MTRGAAEIQTLTQVARAAKERRNNVARAEWVTLPVECLGFEQFQCKRVGLLHMLGSGKIPSSLEPTIVGLIQAKRGKGDGTTSTESVLASLTGNLAPLIELYDRTLILCSVFPRFVEEGKEDEDNETDPAFAVTDERIPFEVKQAIFNWANGGATEAAAAPFRDKPADVVADGSDRAALQPTA